MKRNRKKKRRRRKRKTKKKEEEKSYRTRFVSSYLWEKEQRDYKGR
jgi:hypothetical protein